MKQKKNLRQIFSVFLTCMMIIGVALANDHIFVEGEGKPQAEQQVQEGEPEQGQEQEQGDPGKPGEQKPEQGEIQEGKPQQEPEQGQEPGQQEQGQGDSGKPGELPGEPVELRGEPKELTDVKVDSITLTDVDGTTVTGEYGYWNTYRFNMKWDATGYGNDLKSGDYFIAKLPKQLKFPITGTQAKFDFKDKDSNVIAKGEISFEDDRFVVKVTFTDAVVGNSDVKGEFFADVPFNRQVIGNGPWQDKLEVEIGDKKFYSKEQIHIGEKPPAKEKHFEKWGSAVTGESEQVQWTIRLNIKKNSYSKLKFEDELLYADDEENKSHYIPESFIIKEVELNKYGEVTRFIQTFENNDIIDYFKFDRTNTKFTFNFEDKFGPINGREYVIYYKTDYIPGETITNRLKMSWEGAIEGVESHSRDATFKSKETGGSVQGDLSGKIKITKIDNITREPLANATFEIIKSTNNGEVVESVTTNNNGVVYSKKLDPGDYIVKETTAPDGYIIDEEWKQGKSVTVTDKKLTSREVGNKKAVTIKATKKWVDNGFTGVKKEVFFRLLGDGNPVPDTTKAVSPTNEVEWKVRKYNNQGIEIEYTVEEVDKDGAPWKEQNWTTSGPVKDKNSGKFIITNTYNPQNSGGGGSGGGQSGGGSGGTGGDDSNKPKPNDPKPNNPKPNNPTQNGPTPSDDSTGMGGATPPDGSVVSNDSTTSKNTVAPKNQKMPKSPVLTDKQGVKKTAQAGRRLPKTGEGANPTLYAWMLGALGSMLVLVGYRKRKTVK